MTTTAAAPTGAIIPLPTAWSRLLTWGDRRRRRRKLDARRRRSDVVLASHAKSGRTWLRVMISHLYQRRYGIPEPELINFDNFHRLNAAIPKILFWGGVADGSTRPSDRLAPAQVGLLLVRDPLDVVVSFHEHLAHRATARERARKGIPPGFDLAGLPLFDFARDPRLGLARIVRFMNAWDAVLASRPDALLVRYEDLQRDAAGQLTRIVAAWGGRWRTADLEAAAAFGSFATMRQREREGFFNSERMRVGPSRGEDAHKVREGRVGAHRQRFSEAERRTLRRYIAQHLSPRLGYREHVDIGTECA